MDGSVDYYEKIRLHVSSNLPEWTVKTGPFDLGRVYGIGIMRGDERYAVRFKRGASKEGVLAALNKLREKGSPNG